MLKNLPAITRVTETWVQLLGKEDPLEKVMAPHSSVGWRIPATEEPGGLSSIGLHRLGHE